MRTAFVNSISELMSEHEDIVTITADMGFSVFEELREKFPDRFINTGVTEQSSASLAAGMALSGYTVYFYAQAAFASMRCFEQVRLDMGYNQLNVKVVGTAAGFSLNQLGVSHFALEDVGLMRLIPGMTVFAPGDAVESDWATRKAYEIDGPAYIRLTKGGTPVVHTKPLQTALGEPVPIKSGDDLSILVSGSLLPMSVRLADEMEKTGVSTALYSVPVVKPIKREAVKRILTKTPLVCTLEEHYAIGGLGSAIAEIIAEEGLPVRLLRLGVPDMFTGITGSHEFLLDYNGLSLDKAVLSLQKSIHYGRKKTP